MDGRVGAVHQSLGGAVGRAQTGGMSIGDRRGDEHHFVQPAGEVLPRAVPTQAHVQRLVAHPAGGAAPACAARGAIAAIQDQAHAGGAAIRALFDGYQVVPLPIVVAWAAGQRAAAGSGGREAVGEDHLPAGVEGKLDAGVAAGGVLGNHKGRPQGGGGFEPQRGAVIAFEGRAGIQCQGVFGPVEPGGVAEHPRIDLRTGEDRSGAAGVNAVRRDSLVHGIVVAHPGGVAVEGVVRPTAQRHLIQVAGQRTAAIQRLSQAPRADQRGLVAAAAAAAVGVVPDQHIVEIDIYGVMPIAALVIAAEIDAHLAPGVQRQAVAGGGVDIAAALDHHFPQLVDIDIGGVLVGGIGIQHIKHLAGGWQAVQAYIEGQIQIGVVRAAGGVDIVVHPIQRQRPPAVAGGDQFRAGGCALASCVIGIALLVGKDGFVIFDAQVVEAQQQRGIDGAVTEIIGPVIAVVHVDHLGVVGAAWRADRLVVIQHQVIQQAVIRRRAGEAVANGAGANLQARVDGVIENGIYAAASVDIQVYAAASGAR